MEEQAVQALENIRLILAAEGAGPEHIVKLTFYAAAKPGDMAEIGAKRAEMFGKSAPPPSTWVYVSGLARPGYLIEIEAVAAVPAPGRSRRTHANHERWRRPAAVLVSPAGRGRAVPLLPDACGAVQRTPRGKGQRGLNGGAAGQLC